MKNIIFFCILLLSSFSLYAQKCPNYPADCPETEFIEQSQNKQDRIEGMILPQEIVMQDKMRAIFTGMMENAAKTLHWDMLELKEYTNDWGMQSGRTPYPLRSPRGINITFQFIANKDSLQAWKNYQTDYDKRHLDNQTKDYNNIMSIKESPLYKKYKDSADYYMNLYLAYIEKHKDEGVALYTKDKHPRFFQQKEKAYLDKMVAMTEQTHENAGIEEMEEEHDKVTMRYRNNTVVQVNINANTFVAEVGDLSFSKIGSTSYPLSIKNVTLAKFYTIGKAGTEFHLNKWTHAIIILLGNFHTTTPKDYKYYYYAGFRHTPQGDEHTPKKIKSDKVQNISIAINGKKEFIEKMLKFIDVDKLNGTIVKF